MIRADTVADCGPGIVVICSTDSSIIEVVMEAREAHSPTQAFQLSLRVRHPNMDPMDVSRELHIAAEYSFKAGDARHKRGRTAHAGSHTESYWFAPLGPTLWESDQDPTLRPFLTGTHTLELALLRCVYLLRRHGDFLRRMQSEGGEIALLVEVSSEAISGFSLTPACAGALHELSVGVDFEFTH